jgi:predicted amidohydrolase YtcJ
LKAVAINSAWQSKEKNSKGSINVGKTADPRILN